MYYEINVARKTGMNGIRPVIAHLFATAPRSITSAAEAKSVLAVMLDKFPESEGYVVTCTRYETTGRLVTTDDLMSS